MVGFARTCPRCLEGDLAQDAPTLRGTAAIFLTLPPHLAEKITNLIRQTISGDHGCPITDFSGSCSKLILQNVFPVIAFTYISGNRCSTPI